METSLSVIFFNDTATTEIYTLSLHDALPISGYRPQMPALSAIFPQIRKGSVISAVDLINGIGAYAGLRRIAVEGDRKSTRLNSSHANLSYAVFCLNKKTTTLTATLSLYSLQR